VSFVKPNEISNFTDMYEGMEKEWMDGWSVGCRDNKGRKEEMIEWNKLKTLQQS
jgi:hypothetical protein